MSLEESLGDESSAVSFRDCPRCAASNAAENLFCAKCGAALDAILLAVDKHVDLRLKQELDRAIKERFGDREAAELGIAAAVAERLAGWTKILAFAVGIPLALGSSYLGFLGWKLQGGLSEANKKIAGITAKADLYSSTLEQMQAELQPREAEAAKVKEELVGLQELIKASTSQLQNLPELTHKVDAIDARLKDVGAGAGSSAFRQAETSGQARGIDVSSLNAQPDWQRLQAAGISFAYFKASEGAQSVDRSFQTRWDAAKKQAILRGAYHFLRAGDIPAQVDSFLRVLKDDTGELPPMVDFENVLSGQSASPAELLFFLEEVKRRTGCTPIVATGSGVGARLGAPGFPIQLGLYPLWLMDYKRSPQAPFPWKVLTFWQAADGLSIDGMAPTDFDTFNGTEAQLRTFAQRSCLKK